MLNSSLLSKKVAGHPEPALDLTCWVLTEGMIGTQNQCVGIAETLGLNPTIKQIGLRQPWKKLTPWLGFETKHSFIPTLRAPWPDLLIASGRKSVAASRYIKKKSQGKTFTVQVQDPKTHPNQFDLVAVPFHDKLRGDNVIVTNGAPNKITSEKLKTAKKEFASFFKSMPSPRVAVLIGGDSRTHKLTQKITETFCRQLATLNAPLMITTSRRTGQDNLSLIEQELTSADNFIWDGTSNNPYLGMLAWADYIIVTSDSVSMLSDAGTTGKPVYVIDLEGQSNRFEKLHTHFRTLGVSRPFDGNLEHWEYEPLNDAQKVASQIYEKLSARYAKT